MNKLKDNKLKSSNYKEDNSKVSQFSQQTFSFYNKTNFMEQKGPKDPVLLADISFKTC